MVLLKRIWTDPVGSAVIAGVILAALLGAVSYFDWWPAIQSSVAAGWTFVRSSTAVPNWLLGIGVVCIAFALCIAVVVVWALLRPSPEGTWRHYTTDEFFGLRWQWKYLDSNAQVYSLCPLCPKCQYQVTPQLVHTFPVGEMLAVREGLTVVCDLCGHKVGPIDGDPQQLLSKVERLIHQKLRTGSWPPPCERQVTRHASARASGEPPAKSRPRRAGSPKHHLTSSSPAPVTR